MGCVCGGRVCGQSAALLCGEAGEDAAAGAGARGEHVLPEHGGQKVDECVLQLLLLGAGDELVGLAQEGHALLDGVARRGAEQREADGGRTAQQDDGTHARAATGCTRQGEQTARNGGEARLAERGQHVAEQVGDQLAVESAAAGGLGRIAAQHVVDHQLEERVGLAVGRRVGTGQRDTRVPLLQGAQYRGAEHEDDGQLAALLEQHQCLLDAELGAGGGGGTLLQIVRAHGQVLAPGEQRAQHHRQAVGRDLLQHAGQLVKVRILHRPEELRKVQLTVERLAEHCGQLLLGVCAELAQHQAYHVVAGRFAALTREEARETGRLVRVL
mmetsp:Transcript_778/g.2421  ORF Transcript_778/g.2421 Transcript_778/m.2421 type:complete len:328 (+) Transcript_778:3703-4686(+)